MPTWVDEPLSMIKNRDDLIKLQRSETSITHLYDLVQNDPSALDDKAAFYLDQNVLMRASRSKMSPNIPGTEYTQIVVPSVLRVALLQVVHVFLLLRILALQKL